MKKRVLLTGGSGFVGSFVAARLREQPGIELVLLGQEEFAGVRLGQTQPLLHALSGQPRFDAVVHLAAHIGNSPDEILAANLHGIHDILDFCNCTGVGRLVHLSRSFAVKRGTITVPSTRLGRLYEYSKRYAELVLHEQSRVATRILRITAPIWPTMPRERYLSQILLSIARGLPTRIYGRGRRRQNYVRLDDIALAVDACLTEPEASGIADFWVAGPESFTDFDLAQAVAERLGVPFNYEFVTPPAGIAVDEADYGIDLSVQEEPSLPARPRALDGALLRTHLNMISQGSTQ